MNDERDIDVKMKAIAAEGDAVTTHWARAILLIGAGILILGGLITDASKLMDAWASLGRALAGQNAESGSKARLRSWNDEVIQEISALESRFNLESPLCTWVQPWVQSELARMGEGGDEVMVGNDGWLFYRKSFEHLTARSPADLPGETQERGYEAALDAVLDFADHLQGRDIDLVIVPIPPKLAVHADQFNPAYQGGLIETADYQSWLRRVQAAGVRVFEVGNAINHFHAQSGLPAYLKTDTHWRPEAMEWCAGALVDFLGTAKLITESPEPVTSVIDETSIRARGDLWRMLRLSDLSSRFKPEAVTLRQIRTANGMRWQADRSSDVLLLGDSFSNIYSLAQMGWGDGAGFAEHLGHRLGRPLDAILRNSDGAHATRQILSRELARGFDRLDGKSLVIWEFAARELTQGRWPKFSYQLGEKVAGNFIEIGTGDQLEFEATLVDISPIPVPGSVPYQDFLATLHLRDVGVAPEMSKAGSEILVYAPAMMANRWTEVATLRPGQRLRMKVGNWLEAEARYGRWNRSELSEDLLLEPVNWMVEMTLVEGGDE